MSQLPELNDDRADIARDRTLTAVIDHITPGGKAGREEKWGRAIHLIQEGTLTGKALAKLLDISDAAFWMDAVTVPADVILDRIAHSEGWS
jgi:hypothetical protein